MGGPDARSTAAAAAATTPRLEPGPPGVLLITYWAAHSLGSWRWRGGPGASRTAAVRVAWHLEGEGEEEAQMDPCVGRKRWRMGGWMDGPSGGGREVTVGSLIDFLFDFFLGGCFRRSGFLGWINPNENQPDFECLRAGQRPI